MKVFICDISKVSKSCLEKIVCVLSKEEKDKLQKMISLKRQKEFIAGHYLLRRLLSQYLNRSIEDIEIKTLQSGALILADKSLGYISLSHSFDYVAIAISSYPIGLDMEKMRFKNNFNEILEQIDSVKAAAELMKNGISLQESFFRLWTKKEAFYKLNSVFYSSDQKNVFFSYHQHADFMLCLASPTEQEIHWKNISFENS